MCATLSHSNLFVRDMDLGVHDNRRLEVVADGLPLFGGVQLAVDTTLVSAIQGDGQPQRGAADNDGVALKRARRRKETTHPEFVQPGSRARLVVLALEVGGVGHRKPGLSCSCSPRLAPGRSRF